MLLSNLIPLSMKHSHPRDSDIVFDQKSHTYTIKGEEDYTSVTEWNHSHFKKFDPDSTIKKMMESKYWKRNKYYGMDADSIKSEWDKSGELARHEGTRLHTSIENFYNGISVYDQSFEFRYFLKFHHDHVMKQSDNSSQLKGLNSATQKPYQGIKVLDKDFDTYNMVPYRTEWQIYDEELKLAGTIDMVFKKSDGTYAIYDWKRSKEIKYDSRYGKALTDCISHLPDSNYWHYCLQLNTYKAIIERNYGMLISEMFIVSMHPDYKDRTYHKIQIKELNDEINNLFELRIQHLKDADTVQITVIK